jgi:hypothetical protein
VPPVSASTAILGLIGTSAAYVLSYQAIVSEGAAMASTVTCLLSIIAIALGVVAVLGESRSPAIAVSSHSCCATPCGGLPLRAGKAVLDGKRNTDSRLSVGWAFLLGF